MAVIWGEKVVACTREIVVEGVRNGVEFRIYFEARAKMIFI